MSPCRLEEPADPSSETRPYPAEPLRRSQDMDNDEDDFEPVVRQLRALGEEPVDEAVRQRVLERSHPTRLSWIRSTRTKVAAAAFGGFMIGTMGLASAGALPEPAQGVAHGALGTVGIRVPPGHDRYNGPECGGAKTHGEYVEAHKDDPAAGRSPCGKPNVAVNRGRDNRAGQPGRPEGIGRGGPPPWAGRGGPPPWAGQGGPPPRPAVEPSTTTTTP